MKGTSQERRVRSRQLLLAGSLTIVSFAAASVYCLATWSQPNRPTMLLLYVTGMALGGSVAVLAGRLAGTTRPRRVVMVTLTVLSVSLITAAAHLDGGADAPVVLGFLPPMAFIAVTVRPRLQLWLQGLMVLAYLSLAVVGDPPRPGYVFLHLSATLVIVGVCAAQAHIVARQRAELRALARVDPLTGALNRRVLDELSGPAQPPVSVICLDFDDFKLVNDRLGHPAGDELLRWAVAAMRLELGPRDMIARLGGDEFLIVLPGTHAAGAVATAERLVTALGRRIGASAGTGTAPADGDTLQALISRADQRLYEIKRQRRRHREEQHAG